MKYYEFKMDCGDGSYDSCRFRTYEEATDALELMEAKIEWFLTDGDGITEVDTESEYFWFNAESFVSDFATEEPEDDNEV